MNEDAIKLPVFISRYADLATEGGLRWQIFNRHENGIEKAGAIIKGRDGRWYVSPSRYREWLCGGVQ
jgi:hypothetical protein